MLLLLLQIQSSTMLIPLDLFSSSFKNFSWLIIFNDVDNRIHKWLLMAKVYLHEQDLNEAREKSPTQTQVWGDFSNKRTTRLA